MHLPPALSYRGTRRQFSEPTENVLKSRQGGAPGGRLCFAASALRELIFPWQNWFPAGSAFSPGHSLEACPNLDVLLLVLHIFRSHMGPYLCNAPLLRQDGAKGRTQMELCKSNHPSHVLRRFLFNRGQPRQGQNETDSGNLTYILVCLLWKVIFPLITNFLKAGFSKQSPGARNLPDSSTLCQNAPPSSPSDRKVPCLLSNSLNLYQTQLVCLRS